MGYLVQMITCVVFGKGVIEKLYNFLRFNFIDPAYKIILKLAYKKPLTTESSISIIRSNLFASAESP